MKIAKQHWRNKPPSFKYGRRRARSIMRLVRKGVPILFNSFGDDVDRPKGTYLPAFKTLWDRPGCDPLRDLREWLATCGKPWDEAMMSPTRYDVSHVAINGECERVDDKPALDYYPSHQNFSNGAPRVPPRLLK